MIIISCIFFHLTDLKTLKLFFTNLTDVSVFCGIADCKNLESLTIGSHSVCHIWFYFEIHNVCDSNFTI